MLKSVSRTIIDTFLCFTQKSSDCDSEYISLLHSPQVVLALASAAAQAQVLLNGGLPYPYAAGYAAAPAAYAAAPAAYAAAPAQVAYAHNVPAPVSHSLGLPEAATYVAPPVRQVAHAPVVEQVVEPVEQWGYKVAY